MVDTNNIVTKTDSYKLNHWNQYPQGTETVYSYFESRKGAAFPYRWDSPDQLVTVFENGLLTNTTDFATVRERAALQAPISLTR